MKIYNKKVFASGLFMAWIRICNISPYRDIYSYVL